MRRQLTVLPTNPPPWIHQWLRGQTKSLRRSLRREEQCRFEILNLGQFFVSKSDRPQKEINPKHSKHLLTKISYLKQHISSQFRRMISLLNPGGPTWVGSGTCSRYTIYEMLKIGVRVLTSPRAVEDSDLRGRGEIWTFNPFLLRQCHRVSIKTSFEAARCPGAPNSTACEPLLPSSPGHPPISNKEGTRCNVSSVSSSPEGSEGLTCDSDDDEDDAADGGEDCGAPRVVDAPPCAVHRGPRRGGVIHVDLRGQIHGPDNSTQVTTTSSVQVRASSAERVT